MDRRDLLKLSPLALASTIGHVALGQTATPSAKEAMFNAHTFGATGDGKTIDTPAINKAIEAIAAQGGGTLVFPAGTYVCFTIHLKSYVDLYLSHGCTILAADSPMPNQTTGYNGGTYDAAEPNDPWIPYQDYGHNHWKNSLFYGENLHDFAITGPGLIHGKGLSNGTKNVRSGTGGFVAEQAGVGNKAIALKNCFNVLLRDFSILKGGHFALLATGVDNMTIDNLLVDTDRDGFDIDCCRNVRVSNCTVNSPWDDAICPKSSYALGYARATENVTIVNCYVTAKYQLGTMLDGTWKPFEPGMQSFGTGRIKCGTESNGGFKNITISNCVFEGCQGLALESEDGALCEDITITNIAMREIVSAPIFIRLGTRMRGPKGTPVGTMKRILISNIVSHASSAGVPSIISGVPGYNAEDIKIADLYLEQIGGGTKAMAAAQPPERAEAYPDPEMFGKLPSTGFFIRHARNVEMSNVEIATQKPDERPAFWLHDVAGADFFRLRVPSAAPAFTLKDVRDFRVFGSLRIEDTIQEKVDNRTI
jgi:polygalacturonase